MKMRISELRHKDVISVADGRRLGTVEDVELEGEAVRISALILPGAERSFFFSDPSDEVIIPWSRIRLIGVDAILVADENEPMPTVQPPMPQSTQAAEVRESAAENNPPSRRIPVEDEDFFTF